MHGTFQFIYIFPGGGGWGGENGNWQIETYWTRGGVYENSFHVRIEGGGRRSGHFKRVMCSQLESIVKIWFWESRQIEVEGWYSNFLCVRTYLFNFFFFFFFFLERSVIHRGCECLSHLHNSNSFCVLFYLLFIFFFNNYDRNLLPRWHNHSCLLLPLWNAAGSCDIARQSAFHHGFVTSLGCLVVVGLFLD